LHLYAVGLGVPRTRVLVIAYDHTIVAFADEVDAATDEERRRSVDRQTERHLTGMHGDDIVRETRQRDGEIPLDLRALGIGELGHAGERRRDRSGARRGREVEVEHLEDGMGSETEPDT